MTEQTKDSQELILIFVRIYFFVKRYFFILLIFIIAGIAYGYYSHSCSTYFYKKHLGLSSNVINKDINTDIIKSLQPLIDEQNTAVIARKLNISDDAAASITRIDTNSYRNKLNLGFIIDITFSDSSYSDTLTSGLLYFLNHNEYYQKNRKIYIEDKQNILAVINEKLGIQDSSLKQLPANQLIMHCVAYNPHALSSDEEIMLLEKKFELEKEILDSEYTVVEDSTAQVYTETTLLISILIYGAGFCIMAILLLLLIESISQTRKHLKEHKR